MKYYLDTDQSGHWYIVPVDRSQEWSEWQELDDDDERAWEAPEWAQMVGGAPQAVQFENPEVNFG